MIKQSVTPKEVVDFLNELLKVDRLAINAIFNSRVYCNKEMAEHPTIQVGRNEEVTQVGIVGILNGLFGTYDNDYGCISVYIENGEIEEFRFHTEERLNEILANSGGEE